MSLMLIISLVIYSVIISGALYIFLKVGYLNSQNPKEKK